MLFCYSTFQYSVTSLLLYASFALFYHYDVKDLGKAGIVSCM